MKKIYVLLLAAAVTAGFYSCKKESDSTGKTPVPAGQNIHAMAKAVYSTFPETFESGTKGAYAAASVTLSTGSWYFDNALLGTLATDHKNGTKCVRIQSTGTITMQFDVTNGASQVDIVHATFGTDGAGSWGLWYSTDGGTNWTQTGSNVNTTSATPTTATFLMNINGNVRFQVRKLTGNRLNFDDFSITDNDTAGSGGGGGGTVGGPATRDDNMGMGNPSGATTNTSNTSNYLMVKTQYALSYNNGKGMANWVSWHLSTAWKGSAVRCDCFKGDPTLPTGYFKAVNSSYTGSGFDRGHMCPSADRDGSDADNEATFYMTNITSQAPNLNQGPWNDLEAYCRTLITAGNELYIISGGYGTGGTGSSGAANTIASGSINVPSHFWKVIVVLPIGTGDASRVSTSTRVIAVDMPNTQTSNTHTWGYYRTSVDAIETATGYDFLSAVSTTVQSTVEASVDNGPTN